MAGGRNEVKQAVNPVVTEARVTLDTRFLCKNFVVLSLKIATNFGKVRLVVNLFSKA